MTHLLDDAPLSTFHKKLALFASDGPFLDGYILSIIGVALVQITPYMTLRTCWESARRAYVTAVGGCDHCDVCDLLPRTATPRI